MARVALCAAGPYGRGGREAAAGQGDTSGRAVYEPCCRTMLRHDTPVLPVSNVLPTLHAACCPLPASPQAPIAAVVSAQGETPRLFAPGTADCVPGGWKALVEGV